MSLREAKKQLVGEEILNAAERLFRERGFSRTTMAAIAGEACVSRQTLVNYFGTKEEILAAIGNNWLRCELEKTRRRLVQGTGSESPVGRIRQGIRLLARAVSQDREFMRLVYERSGAMLPRRSTGTHSGANNGWEQGFNLYAGLYRAAQERREIHRELDPDKLAEMTFAVQFVAIHTWLTGFWRRRESLEKKLLSEFDVLLHGATVRAADD